MDDLTVQDKETAIRSGYIRGQHAYEANDSHNYVPHDKLPTPYHVQGYKMGWMGRLAAEAADLEPSVIGVMDGPAPRRWWR